VKLAFCQKVTQGGAEQMEVVPLVHHVKCLLLAVDLPSIFAEDSDDVVGLHALQTCTQIFKEGPKKQLVLLIVYDLLPSSTLFDGHASFSASLGECCCLLTD